MQKLSFKNVGIKQFSTEDTSVSSVSALPIGIKTPLELDYTGFGIFVMHTQIEEQIDDNYKNLILTNWGDRVSKYDFGANLRPLLADFSHKENFDEEAMIRINTATSKWMPFITPENYFSDFFIEPNSNIPTARIQIEYSISSLNVSKRNIEVNLFTI